MIRNSVLLTRPEEESAALAACIARLGLHPIVMPTLEIVPVAPDADSSAVLAGLRDYHFAIFISRNAVRCGFTLIERQGGWPSGLRAAAVGPATAQTLRALGIVEVIVPEDGADSEALLRCAPLQAVAGKRVVIFRGVGGRETLAQTLAARGAQVRYVECYQRVAPAPRPAQLLDALLHDALAAVVAASSEGLGNLARALEEGERGQLLAVPLFVQHENVAARARVLGFRDVIVFAGGDEGLCQALRRRLAPPT